MLLATIALVILAVMGVPLFIIILASAMLGFVASEIELTVVAIEFYRIVDMPVLVSIPLFTLAGTTLAAGNASERLVRLFEAWFGWMPGGSASSPPTGKRAGTE